MLGCFPFPSASSVPKEDAQLQGTNTDTLELLIPLIFFFFFLPFKTLQDGFTFCFGKLSGIRVGEGEEQPLLAPENGQCSVCN